MGSWVWRGRLEMPPCSGHVPQKIAPSGGRRSPGHDPTTATSRGSEDPRDSTLTTCRGAALPGTRWETHGKCPAQQPPSINFPHSCEQQRGIQRPGKPPEGTGVPVYFKLNQEASSLKMRASPHAVQRPPYPQDRNKLPGISPSPVPATGLVSRPTAHRETLRTWARRKPPDPRGSKSTLDLWP